MQQESSRMRHRRAVEAWETEGGATAPDIVPQPHRHAAPAARSERNIQPPKESMMHLTKDTLGANVRARSVESLNRHLAAAIDLHAQLKQAHWNVRGPSFIATHQLFDRIARRVEACSDVIAERAAALGGTAGGTIQTVVEQSFLAPYGLEIADERSHLLAISSAIATFGASAREAIAKAAANGDPVTADIFTEVCRDLESQLWLLESHSPPEIHDMAPASLAVVRP